MLITENLRDKSLLSISNLFAYLSSWTGADGGIRSYVVHHHRDCFRVIAPDTWTQAAALLGVVKIWRKSREEKWYSISKEYAEFLNASYINEKHVYQNSNHEKKPLGEPNLISNALASHALLEFAVEARLRGDDWKKHYEVALDNVDKFIIGLWDSRVLTFRGWPGSNEHINNMTCAAIMALTSLDSLEKSSDRIRKYAIPAAEYTLRSQIASGGSKGSICYSDQSPDSIAIYTPIIVFALLRLSEVTAIHKFREAARLATIYSTTLLDNETGLVRHYSELGYPQWIPDTLGMIATNVCIDRVAAESNPYLQKCFEKCLKMQYPTGGFPLAKGFRRRGVRSSLTTDSENELRAKLSGPNWNAWNLWFMSEMIPEYSKLPPSSIRFPYEMNTETGFDDLRIHEEEHNLKVEKISSSELVYLLDKERDVCISNSLKEYDAASTFMIRWNQIPYFVRKVLEKSLSLS